MIHATDQYDVDWRRCIGVSEALTLSGRREAARCLEENAMAGVLIPRFHGEVPDYCASAAVLSKRVFWLLSVLAISAIAARAEAVTAVIDADSQSDPVTPYEYGMFIEPIGGLIARSLWAEMLDDRKFYYAILPEREDPPPPQSVEGRPGITYRKWRPIGNEEAVRMDGNDPYVGAQSAAVAIQGSTPRRFLDRAGSGSPRVKSTSVISSRAAMRRRRCRWHSSGAQAQTIGRLLPCPRWDRIGAACRLSTIRPPTRPTHTLKLRVPEQEGSASAQSR